MDTDDFIIYIKTDNIYKDIDEDFETRFDTSDYKLECNSIERPFLKGKIVTGLISICWEQGHLKTFNIH